MYIADGKGYDKLQRGGTAAIPLWDFEQPLVNETGAEQAVNSFLSKIDGGTKQTTSEWTNTVAALGNTSLGGTVSDIVGLIGRLGGEFGL